jgi:hypothetical protein
MEFLTALWMPIVLSAVVLFFASFVAWTVLPHHESDFRKAPNEEKLMATVRELNLPPGSYMFPWCSHQEMKNPAMQERYKQGPRGKLVVWDMPNMGRNLLLTFLYFLIVATFTAYIGYTAMGSGVDFMRVFRIIGSIGVLVYASSGQLNAVWFPRRTLMDFIDGIAYGILMGLTFALLWPQATA